MSVLRTGPAFTQEERAEKQRLILFDSVALLSLSAIVVVLSFLTYLLFHSFETHRHELAIRWQRRGEADLRSNRPQQAIEALRSALAYAPSSRDLEVELAEALAAAGERQEATSYFNTLWEAEPGNGKINLALARLAAQQNQQQVATKYYEAAIDGTWQGDGYVRRREVRLELARYLIGLRRLDQARSQLLIAAGNAPNDPQVQLPIAGMLEEAQDPADALHIYREVMQQRGLAPMLLTEALVGAGRTAYFLGQFDLSREMLERAVAQKSLEALSAREQQAARSLLEAARQVLQVYPGSHLSVRDRARRVLADVQRAKARLAGCADTTDPDLAALRARWLVAPQRLTVAGLESNPQSEENLMTLVYATEQAAAKTCGPPMGQDALLLKLAAAPGAVEQR